MKTPHEPTAAELAEDAKVLAAYREALPAIDAMKDEDDELPEREWIEYKPGMFKTV